MLSSKQQGNVEYLGSVKKPIRELKKRDGGEYEPGTITGVHCSIDLILKRMFSAVLLTRFVAYLAEVTNKLKHLTAISKILHSIIQRTTAVRALI